MRRSLDLLGGDGTLEAPLTPEADGGWELMGTAPFATEIGAGLVSSQ